MFSYSQIISEYGRIDINNNVVIITDNAMLKTTQAIQNESVDMANSIEVINLDDVPEYSVIYALKPDDLLIVYIGIDTFMGKGYKDIFPSFNNPKGVAAKYIMIRPTITPQALLEGINTPLETTDAIVRKYSILRDDKAIRITAKSGTNISLIPYEPWTIPYVTHAPGTNAYLPPAETTYSVKQGTANGTIVADVTVGELRVYADLIESFGLVDEPVTLRVDDGEITEIVGGAMAQRLKTELWKLQNNSRKIIEFGIGLSQMTPSGIIGIDESIAGTCHFGIGNGSGNIAPIHLDVVVNDFEVGNQ